MRVRTVGRAVDVNEIAPECIWRSVDHSFAFLVQLRVATLEAKQLEDLLSGLVSGGFAEVHPKRSCALWIVMPHNVMKKGLFDELSLHTARQHEVTDSNSL